MNFLFLVLCGISLCTHFFSASTQIDNSFAAGSFIASPHTYDPRKRLKELDRVYQNLVENPYYDICRKDRRVLLNHNRNTYEEHCIIQRELALKNIQEKCGLKLQRAIASFMIGELRERPEDMVLSHIGIAYQRMLSRPISCIPESWHTCEFTTTKKHAFFIPEPFDDSRLLHLVDLDVDKCVAMCHIPTTVGDVINLDGSIKGLCILFGSQNHLLWNGTDTLLFNHKFPNEPHYLTPAMLRKLPAYTISLRTSKSIAHRTLVARFINNRGKKIKHVIATQQEMNVCKKIVMGQHRQKCLIIGDTWIKTFHAPTNTLDRIRLGGAVNGSMPDKGRDILIHDDFNGSFLRSPNPLFNRNYQGTRL